MKLGKQPKAESARPAASKTPTPRTDAELSRADRPIHVPLTNLVRADFARTLERELAQCREEVERLKNASAGLGYATYDELEKTFKTVERLVAFQKEVASLRAQLQTARQEVERLDNLRKSAEDYAFGFRVERDTAESAHTALQVEHAKAKELLAEVHSIIEGRAVGHAVMYSDRITPLLPRIRAFLAPPPPSTKKEGGA